MRGCASSEHLLKPWTQEALPGGSCRPNRTGTDIYSQHAISSSSSPHRDTPSRSAPPDSRTWKGASPERYSVTASQPPDARTASWALATRRTILDISPSRSWGRARSLAARAGVTEVSARCASVRRSESLADPLERRREGPQHQLGLQTSARSSGAPRLIERAPRARSRSVFRRRPARGRARCLDRAGCAHRYPLPRTRAQLPGRPSTGGALAARGDRWPSPA